MSSGGDQDNHKGVCAAKPLSTATIGDAIFSASLHQAFGGPSSQSILEDLNELRSTGDQWDCLSHPS